MCLNLGGEGEREGEGVKEQLIFSNSVVWQYSGPLCVFQNFQWVSLLRIDPRPVWVLNGEGAELLSGYLTSLATT